MLVSQLKIMVEKRGFHISFYLMMLFSVLSPVYYMFSSLINDNDISMVISKEYAYVFFNGGILSELSPFIIPLISFLTFSSSYITDKKTGYQLLIISRKGSESYYISKFFCSFIGGFIVMFIPLTINIILNQVFLKQTLQNEHMESLYSNILNSYSNIDSNIIVNPEFSFFNLFLNHPQIYNEINAFIMGIICATISVVCYAISLYAEDKYAYFSSVPMIIILLIGRKYEELYKFGSIRKYIINCSLLDYAITDSFRGKSYIFFSVVIILLIVSAYIAVKKKSHCDQI